MSITNLIKDWLDIDNLEEDILKIREEVLQKVRSEIEKKAKDIIKNEDQNRQNERNALEAFKRDFLQKIEVLNSRFDVYLELEGRVNELSQQINQFQILEDRINSIEKVINDKSSKINFKMNDVDKLIADYKLFQPQIVETSKQLSDSVKEIKVIKTDIETGINQFRSELGDLVKNMVSGDIKNNFHMYLKLPDGATVATGNDVKNVKSDISQVNEKIDTDHRVLAKVYDFLVKIYGGNSIIFKDFTEEISHDLPINDSSLDM